MRVINFIGHPLFLVCIFLLFVIEGDHFGGSYILYIFLALPHGALYALSAVAAIASLIGGYQAQTVKWKQLFYTAGVSLITISLLTFFNKSYKTGVDATFRDTVPLLSFILLCLSVTCFIVRVFIDRFKTYRKPE